jgi:hypothetical protein
VYINTEGSLSKSLLTFTKDNINTIQEIGEENIIFHAFHKNGSLNLEDYGKVSIKNSNYVINTEIITINNDLLLRSQNADILMSQINSKNLLINYKCI